MIDVQNERAFLWHNFRAFVGFQVEVWKAWMFNGHFVRSKAIKAYLKKNQTRKLHIGSTYEVDGFLNSQITGAVPIDITQKLPFPDASLDLIYSSHLVEHIHRKQLELFLCDAHRVLRPGGKHIIATPSLEKIMQVAYGEDEQKKSLLFARGAQFHRDNDHTACHQINLTMRAFGHRFLVDLDYMKWIGAKTGYTHICKIDNDQLPDEGLNAYIRARKPERWHCETETFCLEKGEG